MRADVIVVVAVALSIASLVDARSAKDPYVIRFFSDTHIGSQDFGRKEQQEGFQNFLSDLLKPSSRADMLVLGGDIFDLWTVPFNLTQYDLLELAKKESVFGANVTMYVDLVKAVAAKFPVYYTKGNHDDAVTADEVMKIFGKTVDFVENSFILRNTWFMHGCQWDMFNAEPPVSKEEYPVGYFMTRAGASFGFSDVNTTSLFSDLCYQLADKAAVDVLKLIRGRGAFEIIEAIAFTTAMGEDYHNYEDEPILGRSWVMHVENNTSLREVLPHYDSLPEEFIEKTSLEEAANLLAGGCGNFKYMMERMEDDVDAIVLGHTHSPRLDTITRLDKRKLYYGNSGAWIKNRMTFVDVEYHYEGEHPTWIKLFDYIGDHEQETEDLWIYAPDIPRIEERISTRSDSEFRFEDGDFVKCGPGCTMQYVYDTINVYTLAMLQKAEILTIHDSERSGSVGPWYTMYYGTVDGAGTLELIPVPNDIQRERRLSVDSKVSISDPPPETYLMFKYTAPEKASTLQLLIQWFSTEGFQELL